MKYFDCPRIGRRPASEFLCAGSSIEAVRNADPDAARRGLYFGDATARVKQEWWWHRPSHLWFLITRDTRTDDVVTVVLARGAGQPVAGEGA